MTPEREGFVNIYEVPIIDADVLVAALATTVEREM
jgi:hypothetical protein